MEYIAGSMWSYQKTTYSVTYIGHNNKVCISKRTSDVWSAALLPSFVSLSLSLSFYGFLRHSTIPCFPFFHFIFLSFTFSLSYGHYTLFVHRKRMCVSWSVSHHHHYHHHRHHLPVNSFIEFQMAYESLKMQTIYCIWDDGRHIC